jgi:perosamine synthetase
VILNIPALEEEVLDAQRAWPFWRMVPRFDREYRLGDLVGAIRALVGFENGHAAALEKYISQSALLFFARSGRECLYLILKILGLPERSRIGVPLYCCASVFEAIAAAGHVPVFLDIDLETYGLSEEHLRRNRACIDALIVVHTFGYPADIDRLRQVLESDVPLIEDCAHSLFSEYHGRPTGTCSDASFFTFGMHKPAAVGGGAALLVNSEERAQSAQREIARLGAESLPHEIRHSLKCWSRSIAYQRAAYGALLGSPFGRYRDVEPRASSANGNGNHFPPARMRSVDQVLVGQRIDAFRNKLPALAGNTKRLQDAINGSSLETPAEPTWGTWNHFMLPVRYESAKRRDAGRRFLLSRQIDTAPLYQNCARNARFYGYQGECSNAELAAQTLCTVPNHSWLNTEEITYIGESLRLSSKAV